MQSVLLLISIKTTLEPGLSDIGRRQIKLLRTVRNYVTANLQSVVETLNQSINQFICHNQTLTMCDTEYRTKRTLGLWV